MFISRNRVNELMELGQRAEDEELPTFDILREIMEHYRKGIDYLTLLTEVNIARRTHRRLVASPLRLSLLLPARRCLGLRRQEALSGLRPQQAEVSEEVST